MKTLPSLKTIALAATFVTVAGTVITPLSASASARTVMTLDEQTFDEQALAILDASIEAMGGREKLAKLKSITQIGTISVPAMQLSGTMKLYIESPDKLRLILDFPAMGKTIQGLNDGVVWSSDPMGGPRLIPDDEAKDLHQQADLGYRLNFRENYKSIEFVEDTEFDGQNAHKIRLVDHDDQESIEYYSVESKLQIGSEVTSKTQMGQISIVTTIRDYKELDGLTQPTSMIQKIGPNEVDITFDTVSHDKIDDTVFELPDAIKGLIKATNEKKKVTDSDSDGATQTP